ncbi:hypothetical protein L1987_60042 [Smallanthus sonchifolius]|uniref:Uncharacterized protein n=1 Tax=Smallanthus sonchifolius TaxID=185202 RepID=A0ACB9D7U1_9ASTR|nr:hypothetical protein L1987_60042 [Smallanthus sonchifolius]
MPCCCGKEKQGKNTHVNAASNNCKTAPPRGPPCNMREPRTGGAAKKSLTVETQLLSLDDLNKITDSFGSKSLIGEGSNCQVYHGKLSNGEEVIIKKLYISSLQDSESDFKDKLAMISTLKNEYFSQLYGYCLEKGNRILLYQYAPMGCLYDILHGREDGGAGWATPRLSEDKVKQCVDPKLNNDYPSKAAAKTAAVAALCVQYEADFRPNMTIVVKALQPLLNSKPEASES